MNKPTTAIFDVIIVGGGPAGLAAALMLGRACRRVVLIDAGKPRNAAARNIHGFLGHDGIRPQELLAAGRKEVQRYEVRLIDGEVIQAERLEKSAGQQFVTAFSIQTRDGESLLGRKLLLATGMRDELPEVPGLRECYGITIHHCPYCDGWEHRDKPILIYGDEPNEAVGLALAVRDWSNRVTLLTNGRTAEPEGAERLKQNGINWNAERIVRLVQRAGHIEGVELASQAILPAAAMFVRTHQRLVCRLSQALGVDADEPFAARTSRKQKTNVPGLFIAGDADGNVEFAVVAAAEGATAAVAINRELQDEDLVS
jgi:thioredoxin reductase